jgi:hypothetical protein
MEPTDAPMLKRPPARPRSLAGNHSAVAFIPAGLAQPSAKPSSPRRAANADQVYARLCAMLTNDQATANIAPPAFSPTTSRT